MLQWKYQQAVEDLVNQESCPGASSEELELFKKTFRASAYTCRLHSCPRATVGFESEADRHDHEMGHAGGFRCTAPLCQYPPFPTDKSLKSHIATCHGITPPPRSIRRVGLISQGPHNRLGISDSSSLRNGKDVPLARTPTTIATLAPQVHAQRVVYSQHPTATAQRLDTPPTAQSCAPTRRALTPIVTGMLPMPPMPPSSEWFPVKCVCGEHDHDERRKHNLIQCAICGTWQHASCYGREHTAPEKPHACFACSQYSERDSEPQIRQPPTYIVHCECTQCTGAEIASELTA